jgi:hypothetical protein
MKLKSLPKKFEMKNRTYPYVHDENWITNGQFMAKKTIIKDSFKYCIPKEEAITNCERIIPHNPPYAWFRTDTIFDAKELGLLRVFENKKLGKTICFKEDYISHFDIEELLGGDTCYDPFIDITKQVFKT